MTEEKIEELKKRIDEVTKDSKSSKSLAELKMAFFGKQGEISELMKGMRDVPKEKRPEVGKIINALRDWANEKIDALADSVKKIKLEEL